MRKLVIFPFCGLLLRFVLSDCKYAGDTSAGAFATRSLSIAALYSSAGDTLDML